MNITCLGGYTCTNRVTLLCPVRIWHSTEDPHTVMRTLCARRLPLGVPSRLGSQALEAAQGLIRAPGSQRAAGQGCEREAGYAILGALCASGALDADKVPLAQGVVALVCSRWAWELCPAARQHLCRVSVAVTGRLPPHMLQTRRLSPLAAR